MELLNRDQLKERAAKLAKTARVQIAELDAELELRRLKPTQIIELAAGLQGDKTEQLTAMMQAVAWGCEAIGDTETLEEIGLPFGVIVELFDGVAKLSGLDGKEVTAKAGN